jgi:hypothetical protein
MTKTEFWVSETVRNRCLLVGKCFRDDIECANVKIGKIYVQNDERHDIENANIMVNTRKS